MRSGLEIGPDAAAPRVLLIRGRFGRGNCQAYTNQCGRYQQLLPRSAVSSALLGKNLPGFLGLLHALVHGLLRSLLGFTQLAFAPPDARQVEDRKSVVSGKSVSVRVDLGGSRTIQKKYEYK